MPPIAFNTLFGKQQDDMTQDPIPREPPSGNLNAAEPIELPAPKPSESAESAMKPEDFKTETIVPPEESRSDQETEAQREGEQLAREAGGFEAQAKFAEREANRNSRGCSPRPSRPAASSARSSQA